MKKFQVFTKDEFKFIPSNIFIIKNKLGWLFAVSEGAQWYINHTNSYKNCPKEENEETLKAIVKQIKANEKLLKENEEGR